MSWYQHGFFETTADARPDAIAIDDHGATVTYDELERRANRLAHLLRELGCGPNERVCVFTNKTVDMYTAVLGILKAGGCWVPLSTAFPEDRLRTLLDVLRPVAVVVDAATEPQALAARQVSHASFQIVQLEGTSTTDGILGAAALHSRPLTRPALPATTPEDLAYIIFTSGSTGTPKGVMVRHRNTAQFLSLCPGFFDIEPGSRFAHFSDLTFDPSILDLFHCWQTGGTLVPFNRRSYRINPGLFLKEQNINVLFTVPTALRSVQAAGMLSDPGLGSLKHLLLTGEAAPAQLVRQWYDAHPDSTVYNMYGTTETAIVSHWYRIPRDVNPEAPVSIGRPLPGTRVQLMDGEQEVAVGEIGESVVSGSQLSPGYWANSYLTSRTFTVVGRDADVPVVAYRTGDLLREGADGLHYYVGRADTQVKVRGHRVELGEVESTLLSNEAVREAAVILAGSNGGECLVAFVKTEGDVSSSDLRTYLRDRLPTYMVPQRIESVLGSLPMNLNGKVDRDKLTLMASEIMGGEV